MKLPLNNQLQPRLMAITKSIVLVILTNLALASCSSPSSVPNIAPGTKGNFSPAEQIELLLQQARTAPKAAAQQYQLQAIDILMQKGEKNLAQQLLMSLNEAQMEGETFGRYTVLVCFFELDSGNIDSALQRLNDKRLLVSVDDLPLEMQLTISDLRARALALQGSHLASAQERIFIAPMLSEEQQILHNQQALWQSLMYLSKGDTAAHLKVAVVGDYQGWLELATVARNTQIGLSEQIVALEDWLARWNQHPARERMPGGLEMLESLATNQPAKVALLLPLSGKLGAAGRSIRDGFMAAYFKSSNKNRPEVSIIDTQTNSDFTALYQQAVEQGAELIIGPLLKENVRLLFDMVNLPIPTLALNYVDNYGTPPKELFQFGLAATDEAQQVAYLARLEHKHNAMILAPDNNWGTKVSEAFSQRWQELGGKVVTQGLFKGQTDYSKIIKQLFKLKDSESRSRKLSQLISQDLEFEARRRQDIDMIFLVARPHEGRSIKPMLAYHFGDDIPVYATSHIYAGEPSPDQDVDLNGIKFNDIPWTLEPDNKLRKTIEQSDLAPDNSYIRMLALGVDTFHLYPRLKQLEMIPQSPIYGETGTLYLQEDRKINRQLMWAQIKRGKVRTLPLIAYNGAIQNNYQGFSGFDDNTAQSTNENTDYGVSDFLQDSQQQGSRSNVQVFEIP